MPNVYGFEYSTYRPAPIVPDSLRTALLADIGILHYIKDITPILDANMFLIYGAENNFDVADLTVSDLSELAALHKNQIGAYLVNKIRGKVFQIISAWNTIFKKGKFIASLPEAAYRQFSSASRNIKSITYKFNNINTEAIVAVLQSIRNDFISTASDRCAFFLEERIPVDPELIKNFFSFLLEVIDQNIHGQMTDPKQYWILNKDIVNICIPYLCFLTNGLLCEPKFTLYDDPEAIYQKVFYNRFRDLPQEIKEYNRKCRALESAHVIALDATWIDGLVISNKPIIRDTAASKLAGLLMVSAYKPSLTNTLFHGDVDAPPTYVK